VLKTLYRFYILSLILGLSLTSCAKQSDGHARIAVATNFLETAQKLEAAFEAETDYTIDLVSGSTGQLYTQIINGAPYDVFLSADAARVTKLIEGGRGLKETRITYAVGRLVLYGSEARQSREGVLKAGDFKRLAIANPDLAPYGLAAQETLMFMNLYESVSDKIVYGQNVGQAFGLVKTKNAELGLVALSQMENLIGRYSIIPKTHHSPIKQDAVLLVTRKNNKSATAFLNYLKLSHAKNIIQSSGYEVPSDD